MRQSADAVLMIRPAAFGYNAEAAATNRFPAAPRATEAVALQAQREFDGLAAALSAEGVDVLVVEDFAPPPRPDAIFPNNWISFHADGTVVLYPLCPQNRRPERRTDVVDAVARTLAFDTRRVLDLSLHERDGQFLEGTGSLVLDHVRRIAYACLSPRTSQPLVERWCGEMGYRAVCFTATDAAGQPWYHTNVMMSIGSRFAVVAAESIVARDRERVLDSLGSSGCELLEIDRAQVSAMLGNVLEVSSWDEALGDTRVLVLSTQARAALSPRDYARISACVDSMLVAPLSTIERVGGGGARCMLAEVFR
jgi:hypothetical protein